MLKILSLCNRNDTRVSTSYNIAIGEGSDCPVFLPAKDEHLFTLLLVL
jgi:hypothetical protein